MTRLDKQSCIVSRWHVYWHCVFSPSSSLGTRCISCPCLSKKRRGTWQEKDTSVFEQPAYVSPCLCRQSLAASFVPAPVSVWPPGWLKQEACLLKINYVVSRVSFQLGCKYSRWLEGIELDRLWLVEVAFLGPACNWCTEGKGVFLTNLLECWWVQY